LSSFPRLVVVSSGKRVYRLGLGLGLGLGINWRFNWRINWRLIIGSSDDRWYSKKGLVDVCINDLGKELWVFFGEVL
jgi:hypothetical protein